MNEGEISMKKRTNILRLITLLLTFNYPVFLWGMKKHPKKIISHIKTYKRSIFHEDVLAHAAFTKDIAAIHMVNSSIGVLFEDNSFELYDINNIKKPILSLDAFFFRFSKDGNHIAIIDKKYQLYLYKLNKGKTTPIFYWPHVIDVTFAPNGHKMTFSVIGKNIIKEPCEDIFLIDLQKKGNLSAQETPLKNIKGYAFSNDGNLITYYCSNKGFFTFYNLLKNKILPHKIDQYALRPNNDTITIICENDTCPCQLYDTAMEKLIPLEGLPPKNRGKLSISLDGNTIISMDETNHEAIIYIIKENRLQPIKRFTDVYDIQISPKGHIALVEPYNEEIYGYKVYDLRNKTSKPLLENIEDIEVSEDEHTLAAKHINGDLFFYQIKDKQLQPLHDSPIKNAISFHFCNDDKTLAVNLQPPKTDYAIPYLGENRLLRHLIHQVQMSEIKSIQLYHTQQEQLQTLFPEPLTNIKTCRFSPYKKFLAFLSADNTFYLYSIETNFLMYSFKDVTKYTFDPTGTYIIVYFTNNFKTIKLPTKKEISLKDLWLEEKEHMFFMQKSIEKEQEKIFDYVIIDFPDKQYSIPHPLLLDANHALFKKRLYKKTSNSTYKPTFHTFLQKKNEIKRFHKIYAVSDDHAKTKKKLTKLKE